MMSWSIVPLPAFAKRLEKLEKKWRHEILNVLDNLDTVVKTLNAGARPTQIKQFGFAHSEPQGIIAIDQKGRGKGAKLKPFRLYTYCDETSRSVFLITLGDKPTQPDDIKESVAFVLGLLRSVKTEADNKAKEGDDDGTDSDV